MSFLRPITPDLDRRSGSKGVAQLGLAWVFTLSLALLWPAQLLAQGTQFGQQSLAELSPEELGNIEVTSASKEPEEIWKTPAAIYVITQEDIRRSGATSIPEALRLAPGVDVARIDYSHWSVSMRGFGDQFSRAVLVLIDGRNVYTPLFAGVYWDVQNTLLEDIDRIEVIRGPGGTIWGANAFSGVINIITRNAKETHGSLVTAGGGTMDHTLDGVRYGDGNGSNLDYRFYGTGFARGYGFHASNNDFDESAMGQSGFRVDWEPTRRDNLTFQGDLYKMEDGDVTALGSFSPPAQLTVTGEDLASGGDILGRWQRNLKGGSDLQLQWYYDRTNRAAPQYQEDRDTFDIDFLHHLHLPWQQDFIWGAGIRISPSSFTQVFQTFNIASSNDTDSIYSGFLQDEIQFARNKLALTVGTKLEHNSFSGFEIQPNGRLLWTIGPHQTVWVAASRSVRTPSELDDDLELTDFLTATPPLYLAVVGNPKFASEVSVGYELGYRTLITSSLYIDLAAFRNNYSNLSNYGPLSVAVVKSPIVHILGTLPYVNGIEGSGEGFELAPTWRATPWWQLKSSYSYINMDLKTDIGNTILSELPTLEGSSPRNEVSIQSLVNLPRNIEFDEIYRYVSALPAEKIPAYQSADARLGWKPLPYIELSIVGQNLLQQHHFEFGGTSASPTEIKRSAFAKITWTR